MYEKNALIIGASGTVGNSTAKILAQNGFNLGLIGRNYNRLQHTVTQCKPYGTRIYTSVADVTNDIEFIQSLQEIRFNLGHINILIHSVGISQEHVDIPDLPLDKYDEIQRINVRSANVAYNILAPEMQTQHFDSTIVFLGATSTLEPRPKKAAYAASKAALKSLVENMRYASDSFFTVFPVLITPHRIRKPHQTPIPSPELIEPDQVASIILNLAKYTNPHIFEIIIKTDSVIKKTIAGEIFTETKSPPIYFLPTLRDLKVPLWD